MKGEKIMLIDCQECEHHECFDCPVAISSELRMFIVGGKRIDGCELCCHFNDANHDKQDGFCALCFEGSNFESM